MGGDAKETSILRWRQATEATNDLESVGPVHHRRDRDFSVQFQSVLTHFEKLYQRISELFLRIYQRAHFLKKLGRVRPQNIMPRAPDDNGSYLRCMQLGDVRLREVCGPNVVISPLDDKHGNRKLSAEIPEIVRHHLAIHLRTHEVIATCDEAPNEIHADVGRACLQNLRRNPRFARMPSFSPSVACW